MAHGNVRAQFAAAQDDVLILRRQLQAHFPEAVFTPCEGELASAWKSSESDEILVVEFGLDQEFMFPLATGKLDAFVGIIAALSELRADEVAIFQVIFECAMAGGGKIDVVLEKSQRSIACEIAVTTTIDHEVGNVAKCLKAGFKHIAVISPSTDRLQKIEHAVRSSVAADEAAPVTGLVFSKLARLSRNRRELEDFADFFRKHNADLISLSEAIDTSTAGGRMFFHLLGVFAQWEREEITERVNASVLTRAKLGKSINGSAPYGYQWKDRKLVIHPEHAPIRRKAYELFAEHRRKGTVAKLLNAGGYRTSGGSIWRDTNIYRILTDPSAKGVYYFNRFRETGTWKREPKPEDQWGKVECEPIVSESLWNQVNRLIEEQLKSWKRPSKPPVQLFGSLAHCACGHKMYVENKSPKYVCRKCHNKIPIADLESIFHEELKAFFAEPERISHQLRQATKNRSEKEMLLVAHEREIQKVRDEMTRTHRLYLEGGITVQGFGEFYKPAEARLNQLNTELPNLQAEVDFLKVNNLSADDILHEANTLYARWPELAIDEKRKIVESLVEKMTIGDNEIDITFSYLPTFEEACKNQQGLRAGVRAFVFICLNGFVDESSGYTF